MGLIEKIFGNYSKKELKRIEPIKDRVLELEAKYQPMSDKEIKRSDRHFEKQTWRWNDNS